MKHVSESDQTKYNYPLDSTYPPFENTPKLSKQIYVPANLAEQWRLLWNQLGEPTSEDQWKEKLDKAINRDKDQYAECITKSWITFRSCKCGHIHNSSNCPVCIHGKPVMKVKGSDIGTRSLCERPFKGQISVSNTGTAPLSVVSIEKQSGTSDVFSISGEGFTLQPNESREIQVSIDPRESKNYRGNFIVKTSDANDQTAEVRANVVCDPPVNVSPALIEFCQVELNPERPEPKEVSKRISVSYNGDQPRKVTLALSQGSSAFSLSEQSFTLKKGESKEITITYKPEMIRRDIAKLEISSDNCCNEPPKIVELKGTGIFTARIRFDFDCFDRTDAAGERTLNLAEKFIVNSPDKIKVTGYTDDLPHDKNYREPYNEALGAKRALFVKGFFSNKNIAVAEVRSCGDKYARWIESRDKNAPQRVEDRKVVLEPVTSEDISKICRADMPKDKCDLVDDGYIAKKEEILKHKISHPIGTQCKH